MVIYIRAINTEIGIKLSNREMIFDINKHSYFQPATYLTNARLRFIPKQQSNWSQIYYCCIESRRMCTTNKDKNHSHSTRCGDWKRKLSRIVTSVLWSLIYLMTHSTHFNNHYIMVRNVFYEKQKWRLTDADPYQTAHHPGAYAIRVRFTPPSRQIQSCWGFFLVFFVLIILSPWYFRALVLPCPRFH